MEFESTHIHGKGRGKPMGFPTINLKIPENFELKNGIYAVEVIIENKSFKGALHYGPVPTFGELQKSLEVYLIEVSNSDLINKGLENLEEKVIKVKVIKFLRDIIKFKLVEDLVKQIGEDVNNIKKITNDKIQMSNE
jgi:riboflavin kinase/FMN adenylyltransferase